MGSVLMWLLMLKFKQRGTAQGTGFSVMLVNVMLCCKAGHSPCSEGELCLHLQPDSEGEDAIILARHWEPSAEVQCHISEDMIL